MDRIRTMILKECSYVFGLFIAKLVKLSLSEGMFPSIFKADQITPLLKKTGANVDDMANYRLKKTPSVSS